MPDPRWEALADILINHSTRLEKGQVLLIEVASIFDDSILPRAPGAEGCQEGGLSACRDQGHAHHSGEPHQTRLGRADARLGRLLSSIEWNQVHAYIGLRGARNINEMSDVQGKR